MRRLLSVRVTQRRIDGPAALVVGVSLLATCTALVLLMLPELSRIATFVLGAAVGAAWLVLAQVAWQVLRRG
jgi:hypothetical protein